MAKVLQPGGTARKVGAGLKYSMGGKTGTAQVVQIAQGKSYNAAALAVQHRDHAWFIAFAPLDKPKIAIAVILENGGWGANAAPLARALSDYYLLTLKAGGDREIPVDNSGKTTVANPLLAGGAVQRPSENPVTRAFRAAQPEAAQTPASAPVSDGLPASAASEPKP